MPLKEECMSPVLAASRNSLDVPSFDLEHLGTPKVLSRNGLKDDCSTAAPSPTVALDLDLPWSPSARCNRKPGFDLLPTITASSDPLEFLNLSKLFEAHPTATSDFSHHSLGDEDLGWSFSTNLFLDDSALDEGTSLSPRTPRTTRRADAKTPRAPKKLEPTPLMAALQERHRKDQASLIQDILSKNPDEACLPLWDHDCQLPLCYAVRLGCSAEVIQILLEHGADVQASEHDGKTAMTLLETQCAALMQRPYISAEDITCLSAVYELLVQSGAAPSYSAEKSLADCEQNLRKTGTGVLETLSPNEGHHVGKALDGLFCSVLEAPQRCKFLTSCMRSPGAPATRVPLPLEAALRATYRKDQLQLVLDALVEDPEALGFSWWECNSNPPLCFAIECGCNAEVVAALIEHGADLMSTNRSGLTPMMILQEQLEIVKLGAAASAHLVPMVDEYMRICLVGMVLHEHQTEKLFS